MSTHMSVEPGHRFRCGVSIGTLVMSLLVSACGGGPPEGTVVRDSSGLQIIENGSPLWDAGRGWRLSDQPVTVFGETGDLDGVLTQPKDGLILGNGQIVVSDRGDNALHFYGRDGTWVRTSGRSGEGPGEFRAVEWVEPWAGDSILALDLGLGRFTVLTSEGDVVRTFPRADLSPLIPLRPFTDGAMVGLIRHFGGTLEENRRRRGLSREERGLYRLRPGGELVDLPASLRQVSFHQEMGPTALGIPVPFEPTISFTTGETRLYVAETRRFEVRVIGADGAVTTLIRRLGEPRRLTNAEIELARDRLIYRSSHETIQKTVRRAMDDMDLPSTMPAIGHWAWERVPSPRPEVRDLLTDHEGNLWVLEYAPPQDSIRRWAVFDPEGRWLGAVPFANGVEPFDIGSGGVLAWRLDEFDVVHVELYELLKDDV